MATMAPNAAATGNVSPMPSAPVTNGQRIMGISKPLQRRE
jgi:hypothetical protein